MISAEFAQLQELEDMAAHFSSITARASATRA
jgi:hypothetical protein